MSLLFTEGFEWLGTGDDIDNNPDLFTRKWSSVSGSSSSEIVSSPVRSGSRALYLRYDSCYISWSLPSNLATVIIGAAFNEIYLGGDGNYSNGVCLFHFKEGGNDQLSVGLTKSGRIVVYRDNIKNGTLIASGDPGVMSANNWHYVEAKITINNSSGAVDVQVDGVNVLSETSLDTQDTGNAYVDEVRINYGNNYYQQPYYYVDDIYVCDTTGSYNNDFLGPIKIYTKSPDADGNYGAWTPSSGGDAYADIDELEADDDTTYISSSSTGNKDTHSFESLSASGSIAAVMLNMQVKKDDAGARSIKGMCRSSSTDQEGSEQTLSDSYSIYQEAFEEDPNTSAAWANAAAVNAAEFGIKDQA